MFRTSNPLPTKQLLFLKKVLEQKKLYGYKYLEECLNSCFDTSSKKDTEFLLLSKIAKIHVWNKQKNRIEKSLFRRIIS